MNILRNTYRAVSTIIFLAFFVLTATIGTARADTVGLILLGLINQERENNLTMNAQLGSVAEKRSQMIFEGEFKQGEPNKIETPSVLLGQAGYTAEKCGELTAVVIFSNYLSPERASEILFSSLKEQSENESFDLSVFNPEFFDIGVFVEESQLIFSNQKFNAYLCVLEYAVPGRVALHAVGIEIMQKQLLNLINQARKFPEAIFPGLNMVKRLPPLYAGKASDLPVDESIYYTTYEQENAEEAVLDVFQQMKEECLVVNSLEGKFMRTQGLNLADIRIDLLPALDADSGKFEMKVKVLYDIENLGAGRISGLVYSDLNDNGLYEPGEEEADLPVLVSDIGIHSRTGTAGEILEVVQKDNVYRVFVFDKEGHMYYQETDILEDRYLVFNFND